MGTESLGEFLRRERERRGLSLDEIARVTRVRRQHLDALEGDRHDLLPAPPFVRGFLSAYARQVGVSADEVLARYHAAIAPAAPIPLAGQRPAGAGLRRAEEAKANEPAPGRAHAAEVAPQRRRLPAPPASPPGGGLETAASYRGVLVLAGIVALGALAVVGSILSRPAPRPASIDPQTRQESPLPAAPVDAAQAAAAPTRAADGAEADGHAPAEVPLAPAQVAPAEPPVAPSPDAQGRLAAAPPASAHTPRAATRAAPQAVAPAVVAPVGVAVRLSTLTATATEETWMRVTIDSTKPIEALLQPGDRISWQGSRFDIVVGNATGISLELDGEPQPPLGDPGTRVELTLPRARPR